MKPKKSVFGYFVNALFLVGVMYALVCGIGDLGTGQKYPYLMQGAFLLLLLGAWLLLNMVTAMAAKLEWEKLGKTKPRLVNVVEAIFAVAVLCGAAWVRLGVIRNFPMEPASDYKTFYEIAELLKKGTIQKDSAYYCDYIAMFPYVYGYSHFLSNLFRSFGTGVSVAQYANVALAVATVLLVYRTARLAGGRIAGLTALVLSAFWPSQVLYVTQLDSVFLFSFLMMLGVYLFVLSLKICNAEMKHPGFGVLLYIAIGIVLGFCAGVQPMTLLVVLAMILCIFCRKLRLSAEQTRNPSISLKLLSQGWMRCLLVVLCYVMIATSTNMTITQTVDRDLAPGSTAFGYHLLTGLNPTSEGGWNAEDTASLYDTYKRTGDAGQAQKACRDLAVQRLTGAPKETLNLFLRKYQLLWSSDAYGEAWNRTFLKEQGNLTPQREQFLDTFRDWGNLFYLVTLAFAGIAGIFLWRKGSDLEYVFILIFVGMAGMYLLLESQNRYHYPALFLLAMLSGCAVNEIYRMNRAKVLQRQEEKEAKQAAEREIQQRLEKMRQDEAELTQLREAAMQSKFDMKDALERKLIRVSVSEAYDKKEESNEK